MKENYTHITYLLDRSGSMQSVWSDVAGGYQTIIEENQTFPGECTFTLVGFDTAYEKPVDMAPIAEVDPANLPFAPRGQTALLDALGRTIAEMGEALAALPEAERPDKVLLLVQTDGLENASQEYSGEQVRAMIKHQRDVYKWDFMFLGAGEDSIAAQGVAVGMPVSSSAAYDKGGTESVMQFTSKKLLRYRRSERWAKEQAAAFSDEDREKLKNPNGEE